jgi:hypothetical protein
MLTFILLFLLTLSFAQEYSSSEESFNLTEGKNYVNFSNSHLASSILRNKDISVISYYDEKSSKTIGLININNGIGKNFIIVPEVTYEIIAVSNTTLII